MLKRSTWSVSGFRVLLGILLILVCMPAITQKGTTDRKKLEDQQKKLKQQIAYNQKLLQEARKSKEVSLGEINLLNNQIKKRRELLRTIDSEIQYLNRALTLNDQKITQLELEISRLKVGYARTIYLSYKLREPDDRLLYLLASENLNQAWNRMRFLQQMASGRKRLYVQLNATHDELLAMANVIKNQLNDKQLLKDAKNRESINLTSEKDKKGQVLTRIQKEESRIIAEINRKQREAAALEARISQIIREEMKKAASLKKETTPKAKEASEAEIKLSNTFASNKGKLPWPVDKGTISSTFGRHKHPDFDVYTENNGIDFLTTSGSSAKAVFEGEVSEVIQLPSYYAVLVKHGDFFTLYSKLQSVYVRKGEKIPTGHLIGLIKTGDNGTEFHFEVWQGRAKQNPQVWLRQ
ncbi:MAG: peptidoglycan DD-metalloendopeptidase family protein [Bacteroidales bacterium]